MADSLVLKGVKDVKKHTGSEFVLQRPKRGGDTFQLKRWWLLKSNSTVYVSCSLFKVTTAVGTVFLALDTQETSQVRIDHDGSFNFKFFYVNGISRAALFDENLALIEHYVFPKISGGQIMTVTPPGSATRPEDLSTLIGTLSLAGASDVNVGETQSYSVSLSGDAADFSVALTSSNNADFISGLDVTFNGTGTRTLTATVTSPLSSDSPKTVTFDVNATQTVQQKAANADYSYVVTVNNGVFELDGVAQPAINANAGETIYFNLSDPSLASHPLAIYTDATKTTVVSVGVETNDDGTILLFTPPIAGSFSYQCTQHSDMGGPINVS